MNADKQIPYYAPDGRSLGLRSVKAAQRLIEGGHAEPSYGRKGHLKAIWLRREDGSSAVGNQIPPGTRYSFMERLEIGRCWSLRRLGCGNELRPIFLQVVSDCLVRSR